jgi:outer membrane protein TolC
MFRKIKVVFMVFCFLLTGMVQSAMAADATTAPSAQPQGTLHVINIVNNGDGGTAVASNFQMHVSIDGNNLGGTPASVPGEPGTVSTLDVAGSPANGKGSPGTLYTLPAGTYAISETGAPGGYTASFSGGNGDGTATVAAGTDVTITVTNTYSPGNVGLTIQQALDRALAHSNTLRQVGLTIQDTKASYDTASTNVHYTPIGPSPDAAISATTKLISADIQWQMAQKNETVGEDKLDLAVFSAYVNVINSTEGLNYARQAMSNAQTVWNNSVVGNQVGTISQYQQEAADVQIKSSQNNLQSAQIAYNKAYEALNLLMGVAPDTRDVLAEKPAYQPFDIASVEAAANIAVSSDPSIWQLEQSTYLAQVNLNLYNWSSSSNLPIQTVQNNVSSAELNTSSAQDALRQQIRDLYNSILSSEAAYNTQLATLNQAEETLRVAQLNFSLGMNTSADVQAAELAMANAQKTLDATIFQHEYSKLSFEKPWAV